ncbi:MAG: hypothetical protein IKX23_01990 [Treponema sp.]|nr:hypothetical protein [Treponema sp.]
MKKITFSIMAVLLAILLTGCMFNTPAATFTIKNNTSKDLVLNVDYNEKFSKEVFIVEAGKTVKKTITGGLMKFQLKDDCGGAQLYWMDKESFDAKKTAMKNSSYDGYKNANDYVVLTTDNTEYPRPVFQSTRDVSESYTITFTENGSNITSELKAK